MATIPTFDPTAFQPGAPINNPYFPLKPGTIYVYEGEPANEKAGDEEVIRSAVTFDTKDVAGVPATVLRETAWTNGFLQEDTNDWYAQDKDGNVWYLGEATTAFEYDENGNFIGTNNEGAWEAGVDGAQPGYIMPANPQVGDRYYQEFAPNNAALDQAEITRRGEQLNTDVGNFRDGLQTLESTELAPGVFGYKYYAPGVGLVLEEELDKNLKPEFVVELESITSVSSDIFKNQLGTSGNDVIDGNDQANQLKGQRGDDLLQGFGEVDHLLGQDGNDFLIGGDGADKLEGGRGQDILVGGVGADHLTGGGNRDQFVFRTLADRGDVIRDFSRQDVIVLAEIFNSASYGSSNPINDYLQINQVGANTVVQIDLDGDSGANPFAVLATLQNVQASRLSDTHFVV